MHTCIEAAVSVLAGMGGAWVVCSMMGVIWKIGVRAMTAVPMCWMSVSVALNLVACMYVWHLGAVVSRGTASEAARDGATMVVFARAAEFSAVLATASDADAATARLSTRAATTILRGPVLTACRAVPTLVASLPPPTPQLN